MNNKGRKRRSLAAASMNSSKKQQQGINNEEQQQHRCSGLLKCLPFLGIFIVLLATLRHNPTQEVLRRRATVISSQAAQQLNGVLSEVLQKEVVEQETPSLIIEKSLDAVPYRPGPLEAYLVEHAHEVGLDIKHRNPNPTCEIYRNPKMNPYHQQLHEYIGELEAYAAKVAAFDGGIHDLRQNIRDDNNHSVCEKLRLHPEGLSHLFSKSQQLSYSDTYGFLEPLLPPLRHPKYCLHGKSALVRSDFLIHDFEALCHKLKPHSRTVFVDMGASLTFHQGMQSPAISLLDTFAKFGFHFDHVYAYEATPQDATQVMEHVPPYLEASYHWINTGVELDPKHRRNPFRMLLENYNEEDLVIVKLDIDQLSWERDLADQVRTNPQLANLIDHFYFEHHVFGVGPLIKENAVESIRFFQTLRQMGVAAHFWV